MCSDNVREYAENHRYDELITRMDRAYEDLDRAVTADSAVGRAQAERQLEFIRAAIMYKVRQDFGEQATPPPVEHVYLSGPMRGIPEFNFPAFKRKAEELRNRGWDVFSPAEADIAAWGVDKSKDHPDGKETDEPGMTAAECMARDCKFICEQATKMYMMKGWERSTGAQAEWALARAINLPVIYEGDE
jgi:hypothetical protein